MMRSCAPILALAIRVLILALAMIIAIISFPHAKADAIAVISKADSDVFSNAPDFNDGSSIAIRVAPGGAGRIERTFIQWDLPSMLSGPLTVLSANITLTAWGVSVTNRTHLINRVIASWAESTVTWNNQPPITTAGQSSASILGNAPTPLTVVFDVKTIVMSWMKDGTQNAGVRVSDSIETDNWATNIVGYSSRENSSTRPLLSIIFNPGLVDLLALSAFVVIIVAGAIFIAIFLRRRR